MTLSFQELHHINLLNLAGLLIDISGVVLLYYFAPPVAQQLSQRTIEGLEKLGINSFMWADKIEFNKTQKRDKRLSIIGIKMIAVGFILQLLSSFFVFSL